MASNSVAWLKEAKARPFEVGPGPTWTPEANEILIRNHAVAANPIDGMLQSKAFFPLNYPTTLGQDVAGQVIAVGPGVTRFKVGDRVVGHAVGMATKRNQDNGFQLYTILQTNMASELPANISYEAAAVLPLALSTAACGLFQDGNLKLQYPTEPRQAPTGKIILVWGGASSVGSCAIQLLVAAGYEVWTTASTRNFTYTKNLGASMVFDYKSPTVVEDILGYLKGKHLSGAFNAIGGDATQAIIQVLQKAPSVDKVLTSTKGLKQVPEGITVYGIFGTTLKDNAVGKAIYEDFLPKALAAGTFKPAPAPLVVGEGLDKIQDAVDKSTEGLSAAKAVVKL